MKKHTGLLLFAVALYCSAALLLSTWGHTEAPDILTRKIDKEPMLVKQPSQEAQPPKQYLKNGLQPPTQQVDIQDKYSEFLKKRLGLEPWQELAFEKWNCLQLELQCLGQLKECTSSYPGWDKDFEFGKLQKCVAKKKGDDTCSKYTETKPLVCQAGNENYIPKNVSLCPAVTGGLLFDMNCAEGVTAVFSVCQEKPTNSFSVPPGTIDNISYCVDGMAKVFDPSVLDMFVKNTGKGCCFEPESEFCPPLNFFAFGSQDSFEHCEKAGLGGNNQASHEFCVKGSVDGNQCKVEVTLKKL